MYVRTYIPTYRCVCRIHSKTLSRTLATKRSLGKYQSGWLFCDCICFRAAHIQQEPLHPGQPPTLSRGSARPPFTPTWDQGEANQPACGEPAATNRGCLGQGNGAQMRSSSRWGCGRCKHFFEASSRYFPELYFSAHLKNLFCVPLSHVTEHWKEKTTKDASERYFSGGGCLFYKIVESRSLLIVSAWPFT